jgi:hypothetical protein
LREQFHQDDRGDDRVTREVALKVEVVWSSNPACHGLFARRDVKNTLDEQHRG